MEEMILEVLKEQSILEDVGDKLDTCKVKINFTENFTYIPGEWDTTWAYIEIICYDSKIQEILVKNKTAIENIIRQTVDLGENSKEAKYIPLVEIKRGVGSSVPKTELDVSFEENQRKVIENLEKAEFFIWAAVAWITNKKIVDVLNRKAAEGLNVQVILINDAINNKYNYFIENNNLQVLKINSFGYYNDNIMHNKFCIVDGKIALTGSYNWTSKAEYHKENMIVFSGVTVTEYMKEFMKLKKL